MARIYNCQRQRSQVTSEKGYILLATALMMLVVLGAAGLAIDLGRMYIAKNEAQSYVDAAALAAVLQLNGTDAGITSAQAAVTNTANKWNFGYGAFTGTQVDFAQVAAGPWDAAPIAPAGYQFARVSTTVHVPIFFMRAFTLQSTEPVAADAAAGQIAKTGLREGLFPFSPFAHPPAVRLPGADPVSGLVPGGIYTLRWGAGAKSSNPVSTCPGDRIPEVVDIAKAGGGDERGYIEANSASVIRASIVSDYQSVYRAVGDTVNMSGGAKQTQRDALVERVRQDTDRTSDTYAEYFNNGNGTGNGRRLVGVPINLGAPGGYLVVQLAAFFLQDEDRYLAAQGGNKPFCAEYVGNYVQGAPGTGGGTVGYHLVRLVR